MSSSASSDGAGVSSIGSSPARRRAWIACTGFTTRKKIAAAIFFLVVKPMQAMQARRRTGDGPVEDTPAPSDEALLLTEIRDLLRAQQTG